MASAGDEEREPLITKDQTGDDDDGADSVDVSTGFNPGDPEARSTPRQTKMNTKAKIPISFPRYLISQQQQLLLKTNLQNGTRTMTKFWL